MINNTKKEKELIEDLDPFARRKVSTKFNWLPTNRKRQRDSLDNNNSGSQEEGGERDDDEHIDKKIKLEEDIFGSYSSFSGLNIDISSLNKTPTKSQAHPSSQPVSLPSGSLSLKDYLKRKTN